mmetsp:Transcript_963/g.1970  ORF Transcript_963/g.1970 Transcript_963/m.1970 type:complete len:153 (-) Transcript_963:28-486(-)
MDPGDGGAEDRGRRPVLPLPPPPPPVVPLSLPWNRPCPSPGSNDEIQAALQKVLVDELRIVIASWNAGADGRDTTIKCSPEDKRSKLQMQCLPLRKIEAVANSEEGMATERTLTNNRTSVEGEAGKRRAERGRVRTIRGEGRGAKLPKITPV